MNGIAHIAARSSRPARIAFAGIVATASFAAFSGSAAAATSCDLVAASNGSDSAAGTVDAPLKSVQKLVDSLKPGQTGCLRDGKYADSSDNEIGIDTPNVTLTSYPGERAQVNGRIWISKTGDGVTISSLNLDGKNPRVLPSPTVNADDVVISNNDITNDDTAICVSLGSADSYGRSARTLVEGNSIHNCGVLPATNQDHGIYVNSSDDAVIRNNYIYNNADRGIQLYPSSQGTLVTGNVIDGNGEGVIFGGSEISASHDNIVENNVITNSKIRDNIDASWGGQVGTGNIARNNCVGGGAYDDGDGGILAGHKGFSVSNNLIEVPQFVNAKAGNFSIAGNSPCADILAGAKVPTNPGPSGTGGGTGTGTGGGSSSSVTIDTSKTTVETTEPVAVTGSAPGASTVRVMILRNNNWHKLTTAKTARSGKYRAHVRLNHSGRQRLKAVAGGLKDSKNVRVKVKH